MEPKQRTPSEEAVHKATSAAQAVEFSREEQIRELLNSDKFAQTIEKAVINALNRGSAEKKYVDVGRIPFICDDIRGIHTLIAVMSDNLDLIKRIVFGAIVAILLGVLGAAGTAIVLAFQASPK